MRKVIGMTLIFLMVGCTHPEEKENQLQLDMKKLEKVEVKSRVDTCKFIQKVNNKEFKYIFQNKSSDQQYFFEDNTIVCEEFVVEELGKREISYLINGKKEVYVLNIVDSTAPTFINVKDKYVIEKGNIYFNVNQIIKAIDNFDVEIQTSFVGNININQVGEYEVKLIAKDKSENQSEKQIIVKVVDSVAEKEKELEKLKKAEEKKETVIVEKVIEKISSYQSRGQQATQPTQKVLPGKRINKPGKKFYTKSYGKNHLQSFEACKEYMNSSSGGECTPFKNALGNWDGYEFIPN